MGCTFRTGEGTFNFRVGAFIKDGGRLLMARNPADTRESWYSAGGRVRAGETARDALRRELKEETGLDCKVGRLAAALKSTSIPRPRAYIPKSEMWSARPPFSLPLSICK